MPDADGIMSNQELGEMLEHFRWESGDLFERYFINRRRRLEGKPPFR